MKTHYIKILIILGVFMLFIANYLGLFEINLISGPRFSLHSKLSSMNQLIFNDHIINFKFILFLLIGTTISILLPLLTPLLASAITVLAAIIIYSFEYYSPPTGSLLPLEYSLMTIFILFIVNVLINYFTEVQSKQKILDIFQYYVPPEIVDSIARNPEQFSMSGEAKNLTVLFCDIKNFTEISEQINPKQITSLLNEYFTVLSEILYEYGATIDKYIGDAIMSFWGAPISCENHAQQAVLASLKMHEKVKELSSHFINKGWPGPTVCFGINTGMMNVGNMGSRYRVTYTVIGDSVNLASRIEHLTRTYQVPIIINETTMQLTENILYRELDMVTVRGKKNATKIYQPICIKSNASDELLKELDKQNIGLKYFYDEDWGNAIKVFSELKNDFPEDGYYSFMLEKIKTLMN